jgi:hypothetical protein
MKKDSPFISPLIPKGTRATHTKKSILTQEDYGIFLSIFKKQGISCETLFRKVDQYIIGGKLPFDK